MSLAFEPLGPAHAKLLSGMHNICFAEPWGERAMLDLLAMPGAMGWLAKDSEPQGFILARHAADEAEILTILVLSPYRRQGLAADMIDIVVKQAQQLGAVRLFLEVAENNAAGRALYGRLGFAQVGLRPRYYPNAVDALLLARNI